MSYIENRIAALNAAGIPGDKRRRVKMFHFPEFQSQSCLKSFKENVSMYKILFPIVLNQTAQRTGSRAALRAVQWLHLVVSKIISPKPSVSD